MKEAYRERQKDVNVQDCTSLAHKSKAVAANRVCLGTSCNTPPLSAPLPPNSNMNQLTISKTFCLQK